MDYPTGKEATVRAFLWRAHAQSGFRGALGECNAITRRGFGHGELTFAGTLETEFGSKRYSSVARRAFLGTDPPDLLDRCRDSSRLRLLGGDRSSSKPLA
jgi:hypothetical protein